MRLPLQKLNTTTEVTFGDSSVSDTLRRNGYSGHWVGKGLASELTQLTVS